MGVLYVHDPDFSGDFCVFEYSELYIRAVDFDMEFRVFIKDDLLRRDFPIVRPDTNL